MTKTNPELRSEGRHRPKVSSIRITESVSAIVVVVRLLAVYRGFVHTYDIRGLPLLHRCLALILTELRRFLAVHAALFVRVNKRQPTPNFHSIEFKDSM